MTAMTRVVFGAVTLLFAGVLMDTVRTGGGGRSPVIPAPSRSGVRSELVPYLPEILTGAPIQAAVLLQVSDCTGNLRIFELLHRTAVRDRLHLAVIWYSGMVQDSTRIRRLLPAWTKPVPLRPLPNAAHRELIALGHNSTPMLVVLDQYGRVRLTSQSPRSAREFAGLRTIIEGLTWIEEL